MLAISTDSVETLRRFKASIGAPFTFLSDPGGRVASLYAGVSMETANRVTVSIDSDGTIAHVTAGFAAILPANDIKACPAHHGQPQDDADTSI